MRLLLSILGVAAAAILLFVSAAMNWRFGFTLGRTEMDSQIYAAASAAADGMKALLPFFVLWALRQKNYGQMLSGAMLWLVCAAYSLTSSLGFAALNRADVTGERTAQVAAYQELRQELKREQEKLGWVPQHRSVGEVDADLKAALAKPIIHKRRLKGSLQEVSEDCTQTSWLTRKGCDNVLNLRKELAVSRQAQSLETRIAGLKAELARFSARATTAAASGKSDPQADLLSELSGYSTEQVQLGLVILVSLLVELGSGLGLFVAFSHMTISGNRSDDPAFANASSQPKRNRLGLMSRSDVERYYASCVVKADGESVTTSEMHEDYKAWCERKGKDPLAVTVFGRKLSEIGARKTRIGGRMRYVDVQLKAQPAIAKKPADDEYVEQLEGVRNEDDDDNTDDRRTHYAIGG